MFSFIPLALVISLILNAPALWDAFNNPQADLFGTLTRLLLVAVLVTIDVVPSSVVPEAAGSDVGAEPTEVAGELSAGESDQPEPSASS